MKPQRTIAVVIILTASALTAWVSRDIAFPAALGMLGLLGLRRRFTWDFPPQTRAIASFLLLVLAALFSLHYGQTRPSGRMGHEAAMIYAWQTVTRYFLASMILMLFLGSQRRLPLSLGLFHVAVTICAGQVLLLDDRFIAFRLLEVFSAALAVVYLAVSREPAGLPSRPGVGRRAHWVAAGLVLLAASNAAWGVSSVLYRHVESLNYVPIWFAEQRMSLGPDSYDTATVGFSTSGRLSSLVSALQDRTPALTVSSEEPPGYLRAAAFEVYRQSQWSDLSPQEPIGPEPSGPFGLYLAGRASLFRLSRAEPGQPKSMVVRHESRFGRAMFTPLGAIAVEAPLELLLRNENDILQARRIERGRRYEITYSPYAYRRFLRGAHRERLLGVPPQLDGRITALATEIFAGCSTTDEKIAAVVDHFRSRYTYSLEMEIPPDRDKLTHFLLEANQGYCEYFASGAALLLRLAGVPTRYVTGFLVTERDGASGAWIARNLDAHAWVEAWDDARDRWITVEATVAADAADSLLAEDDPSGRGAKLMLARLVQALYGYGLVGILTWFFTSFGLWPRTFVLTLVLAGVSRWALSRRRRAGRAQAQAASDPSVALLHQTLARMDGRVKAAGLRRDLTESLSAFSRRLKDKHPDDRRWLEVSNWYLEYADVRYRRTIDPVRLTRLQQQAAHLRKRR